MIAGPIHLAGKTLVSGNVQTGRRDVIDGQGHAAFLLDRVVVLSEAAADIEARPRIGVKRGIGRE